MHSNVRMMLRKKAVTMPFGTGANLVYKKNNLLIHLFINQINSL